MLNDIHGLPVSTASAQAASDFDRSLRGYLMYRADTPEHLARCIAADPEFALAHCTKGYFVMLTYKQANVPVAAAAAQTARLLAADATPRERQHVAALEAWIAGDLERMLALWEDILADHPTDVLAFRMAHFNYLWLGRPQAMRSSVERLSANWSPDLAGYGTLLACHAFACEECGDYANGGAGGARVRGHRPGQPLGHPRGGPCVGDAGPARGRHRLSRRAGATLDRRQQLAHHLWWHRALFHLERCEFDAVLELYDKRFRNLTSALTQAQPDLYIDIQNAASMLFRLEQQGVDVGGRWIEIADKAEQRIGDCLSAFTLPHWVMALAAVGRDTAAQKMIAAMREFGRSAQALAPIVGHIAVPVAQAICAHRRGDFSRVVDLMKPIHGDMVGLGGSHAQREVLEQLYLDAALKAGRIDEARQILEHAAAQRPLPLTKRVGYAQAARDLLH